MSMRSVQQSVAEINAEKLSATTQAFTGTAATIDLSGVTDPITGGDLIGADGREQPMLVLQADQDFAYRFSTLSTGDDADPSVDVVVTANEQEYVRPVAQTGRFYLSVVRVSSNGTLKIFRSAGAK